MIFRYIKEKILFCTYNSNVCKRFFERLCQFDLFSDKYNKDMISFMDPGNDNHHFNNNNTEK